MKKKKRLNKKKNTKNKLKNFKTRGKIKKLTRTFKLK
jgi:hypothetical protein